MPTELAGTGLGTRTVKMRDLGTSWSGTVVARLRSGETADVSVILNNLLRQRVILAVILGVEASKQPWAHTKSHFGMALLV